MEYKVAAFVVDPRGLESALNRAAKDGWRLHSCLYDKEQGFVCIFEAAAAQPGDATLTATGLAEPESEEEALDTGDLGDLDLPGDLARKL